MFTRCYNLWYGRYFIILVTNIFFYISARVEEKLRDQYKNKFCDFRDPKIYLQHHNLTNWSGVGWPSTLEDLDRLEENNSTYAINVLLGLCFYKFLINFT